MSKNTFKGALSSLYGQRSPPQAKNADSRPSPPPPPRPCSRPRHLHPSLLADEQRAQVKGIKAQSLVNKARNEAKRELEEAQADQPLHLLRVDGRAERLVKNDAQFYAQQQVGPGKGGGRCERWHAWWEG